jgi:hypothetical protein
MKFIDGNPLVLIIILITVTQQITVKKTTLLLFHTTGFDRLNGHHQVYIDKVKT